MFPSVSPRALRGKPINDFNPHTPQRPWSPAQQTAQGTRDLTPQEQAVGQTLLTP